MMVGRAVKRALFAHREAGSAGRRRARGRGPDPPRQRAGSARHRARRRRRFEVRRGEILGLAGLVGAGRTEMARAIFGADPFDSGRMIVDGEPVDIRSPRDAIRHGIGLVPEDRKQQALFLALAIRTNLSMASLDQLSPLAVSSSTSAAETRLVEEYPPGAQHPHGRARSSSSTTSRAATSRRSCWRAGWRSGRRC